MLFFVAIKNYAIDSKMNLYKLHID